MNLSVLVGLWLSILASLAGSPASPRAVAAQSGRAAESSVRRTEGVQVHHALRVPRVVTGVASATLGSPLPHPTPSAALGAPPRSADEPGEPLGRARALHASHAVAARGAVLPYFATAPPLQG